MFGGKDADAADDKPADDAAAAGADQAAAGGGDADDNPSVQEMQEGEYQLHVLIEEG